MKTLYQKGDVHVQLDEATGQVSIMQGMLLAKTCKEGITLQNGAVDESAILGQHDGEDGFRVSMHNGSWDWVPAEVVPSRRIICTSTLSDAWERPSSRLKMPPGRMTWC